MGAHPHPQVELVEPERDVEGHQYINAFCVFTAEEGAIPASGPKPLGLLSAPQEGEQQRTSTATVARFFLPDCLGHKSLAKD